MAKCEAVVVGGTTVGDLLGHLPSAPDGHVRVLRDFDMLGAAAGMPDFTHAHTSKRILAVKELLDAIAELEDPQVGLRLLQACAGHSKVVHSMQCAPPAPQLQAFQDFDGLARGRFSQLTGFHLDAEQWEQAMAQGGADAPAAYLASVGRSAELCGVDAGLNCAELLPRADVAHALNLLNRQGAAPLTQSTALTLKQKELTMCTDKGANSSITAKAVLRSEAETGARAFLLPCLMEPAIFVAELRQRLCMTDASKDAWCPRCDGILDRFSLRAGFCAAKKKMHPPTSCLSCSTRPSVWLGREGRVAA